MLDYAGIRTLAKELRATAPDFLALTQNNDPFYVDVASRKAWALWFVDLTRALNFGYRFHIRRAHYKIISQSTPILKPDSSPYENTENDWKDLLEASRDARYLELIDPESVVDNRNPSAVIFRADGGEPDPSIDTINTSLWEMNLPEALELPELILRGFAAEQRYLVEIWTEKSGQNDILRPLARRYGANLVNFDGEGSESGCRAAVKRALESQRPMRILYLSDFDPAGRSMPVAAARKIEYWLRKNHPDLDVTVDPLALLPEQAEHYGLPRTPIKEGEKRASKFEERFGRGATEIDALEAIHPGELARIVRAGILRHYDPNLDDAVRKAREPIDDQIAEVETDVHERYEAQVAAVQEEYSKLRSQMEELQDRATSLWQQMVADLEAEGPYVDADDIPTACEESDQLAPLFDSKRDELTQLDWYRAWQGRTA